MTGPGGEMPFLDHLEELRGRIIKILLAIVVGIIAGVALVDRLQLVSVLKRPIEKYLPSGKLAVTSPTEPVMIVLKLGLVIGLLLVSPIIIYQIWAFLSPALYSKEKKIVIPALVAGLLLFITGGALGYIFVVPQALGVLFSFQSDALINLITYDAYFDFIVQIVLALGISFELPLLMILLTLLGLVTPSTYNRFRRFAIVGAFILGAVLSPGTDVLSMLMMTAPLLLLYEIGVAGSALVHRRKRKAAQAAAVLLLFACLAMPGRLEAQDPVPPPKPTPTDTVKAKPDTLKAAPDTVKARQDSVARAKVDSLARVRGDTTVKRPPGQVAEDTSRNARVGLPSSPTRHFADDDSVITRLKALQGYIPIRFRSDSAQIFADDKRMRLLGEGMVEREGATLEADTIGYAERDCLLEAYGDPRLFQQGKVAVGNGIRYDTCRKRGVVLDALTTFQEGSTVWFLRGDVAQDSTTTRIFAHDGKLTSCDLPLPHYTFAAKKIKWLSNTVLVARPVVLYIRDIPVLWLPFVFKDLKSGRRSGILIPKVGVADLVRTSSSYQRQITNIGYYWAGSDYWDATFQFDWYSQRYIQYGARIAYNVLDRFLTGDLELGQQRTSGGGVSTTLAWNHQQSFSVSTQLSFGINYVSNTANFQQNALNPIQNTQNMDSRLSLRKVFPWGQATIGATRSQILSNGQVSQTLPSLTINPKPIGLSTAVTWSPSFSVTNGTTRNTPLSPLLQVLPNGTVDTIAVTGQSRSTSANLDTPFRIGSFQLQLRGSVLDQYAAQRSTTTRRIPDPNGVPGDSVDVSRLTAGTFSTAIDWDVQFALPIVAQGKWNLTPSVGVTNIVTGSPFAIRNQFTEGAFVVQGKRALFAINSSPTFYGFFPGIFKGFSRIRHSISPQISFNFAPAATVPIGYARAIAGVDSVPLTRSLAQKTITVGLTQAFEGKTRPKPDDTLGVTSRKVRLLTINTTPITYDFEQASQPGKTGWVTQTLNNTFLSDLLPGFNVATGFDLWRGQAGSDTSKFSPYLNSVSANFSVTNRTIQSILGALGLSSGPPAANQPTTGTGIPNTAYAPTRTPGFVSTGQGGYGRSQGFNASVRYNLSRQRPIPGLIPLASTTQQSAYVDASFAPTPYWNVMWSTQYNFTLSRFESQNVQLARDLHEWRAAFGFQRNANGNVAFTFSVFLIDIPQLKFDYNRATIDR